MARSVADLVAGEDVTADGLGEGRDRCRFVVVVAAAAASWRLLRARTSRRRSLCWLSSLSRPSWE